MNTSHLPLSDLLTDPSRWSGIFFIQCQLFVDASDQCWLAEGYDDFAAGRRIAIPDSKQISDLLDETFPVYGGGCAIHIAECTAQIELDHGVIRAFSQCDLQHRSGYHLRIDHFASGIVSQQAPGPKDDSKRP